MTETAVWAWAMRSLALWSRGAVPERLRDEEEYEEEAESNHNSKHTTHVSERQDLDLTWAGLLEHPSPVFRLDDCSADKWDEVLASQEEKCVDA